LGAADEPVGAPAGRQAALGQLGGFPRAGIAGHNDDRMIGDGGRNFRGSGGNGQRFRKGEPGALIHASLTPSGGCFEAFEQGLPVRIRPAPGPGRRFSAKLLPLAFESGSIPGADLGKQC